MITISRLGKKFRLSRSTLLYYDRLGLVRPSYRTGAGYRLYSAEDEARLRRVCRYRAAGVALEEIRRLLDDAEPAARVADALKRRLVALDDEIAARRRQQHVVRQLLVRQGGRSVSTHRTMTKRAWIELLRAGGMSEREMRQWHVAFEAQSPLAHQDFLESLGIKPAEVRRIRAASRQV